MKLILVIFDATNSAAVLHCLVLNSTQIVVPGVDKHFLLTAAHITVIQLIW